MKPLKFKPDSSLRKRFMVPASVQHPAKLHCGLFLECLERYTVPGQTILDPLAGSGTALLGAMYGRHLILNELEFHFLIPMLASWKKIQTNGPALGHVMGTVTILRGDARCLPLASADVVISSPPWEQTLSMGDDLWQYARSGGSYGDVARAKANAKSWGSYTRPSIVMTSPPYEGTLVNGETPDEAKAVAREARARERHPERPEWQGYAGTGGNVGNLRGPAYWQAMEQIYSECHRVLPKDGLLVLIIKGFTRSSEYVDLPLLTQQCCQVLGFAFVERWERELWRLSFWRVLQGTEKQVRKLGLQMGLREQDITDVLQTKRVANGKLDDRLRYESVLVLRKV